MEHAVALTQALADETRLRLLLSLLGHDATVSDLAAQLDLPQPRVSTHLRLLREVDLVTPRTVGRQRVYHAEADRVRPLVSALGLTAPGDGTPPRSAQARRLV